MNTPEIQTASRAIRTAAGVCTAVYADLVEAAAKTGREPVTVADYASQAIINATLRAAFPQDSILGEEHASDFERVLSADQRAQVVRFVGTALQDTLSEAAVKALLDTPPGNSGRTWIVDPIDGTKGFLAKRTYAIAIALMDGDRLMLGALGCPNLSLANPGETSNEGVLFYAWRGAGAYREPLAGGAAVRIHTAPTQAHEPLVISTSFEAEHSDKNLLGGIVDKLPATQKTTVGLDGQGKYGLVANGSVTCFFRLVPDPAYHEKVWDHAAGVLLVEEAGGQVSDFNGKPLDFTQGHKLVNNRGVAATNGAIHAALLAAIAESDWR